MVTLVSSSGKSIAPPTDQVSSSQKGEMTTEEEDERGRTTPGTAAGRGSLAAITEPKLTQSQPRIIQSGLLARLVYCALTIYTVIRKNFCLVQNDKKILCKKF